MTPTGSLAQPRLTVARGIVAGLVAGVVYAIFADAITVAMNGMGAAFAPFRQIGAVVLGEAAMSPDFDLATAVAAGTAVHFAISAIYGVVFVVLTRLFGVTAKAPLIIAGAIYGLAAYALNYFVLFPNFFPWFLANEPVIQATLHALAFGAVIGWWLSRD